MSSHTIQEGPQLATSTHKLAFEFKEVTKRFNQQQIILDNFNLEVKQGDFVCIVGESGCGKTTLLRLLAGLEEVSSGEIRIEGELVKGPNPLVGFVFQKPVLLKWRTVLENVLLPAQITKNQHQNLAESREQALALLEKVGLSQFLDKFPHQLSGGMQSRVALARSLLLQPCILLCDEPFAALDAITRERMGVSLLKLWYESKGKLTILFVTHDIAEAVFLSNRVLVMQRSSANQNVSEFKINLPQPRQLEMRYDPIYVELCKQVRAALEDEARRGKVGN